MALRFQYSPINSLKGEIRVVCIQPGLRGTRIEAEVTTTSLIDGVPHRFEALSYMWGDRIELADISLNRLDFQIRESLEEILQSLRDEREVRIFWIDAICVNQDDIQEKNQQVQLMRRIYQDAKSVRVWLDTNLEVAGDRAIEMLLTLNHDSIIADLIEPASLWEPVHEILKNPYWKRVWIQQEVSNASALKIQCRDSNISSYHLYHFTRLLEKKSKLLFNDNEFKWAQTMPTVMLPERFGHATDIRTTPRKRTTLDGQSLTLLENCLRTHNLSCTDDRDRVYAIMFLANDYIDGDILIRYDIPIKKVYAQVAKFVAKKYQSLRFLLWASMDYQHHEHIVDRTPTWAPDFRQSKPASSYRQLPPLPSVRPPSRRLKFMFSQEDSVMTVLGFLIGDICHFYGEFFPQSARELREVSVTNFIQTCLKIAADAVTTRLELLKQSELPCCASQNLDFSTVMWTICRREYYPGAMTDSIVREEFNLQCKAFTSLSKSGFLNPDDCSLYQLGIHPPLSRQIDLAKAFFPEIGMNLCFNRPFLSDKGVIGQAPRVARPGDQVWLLPGCECPMMLRPDGENYQVVGEAYLPGVNFWEPLGSERHDVREEDSFGGFTARQIHLI